MGRISLYVVTRQQGDYLAGAATWVRDIRDALQFGHYASAFNVARKFGGVGARVVETTP